MVDHAKRRSDLNESYGARLCRFSLYCYDFFKRSVCGNVKRRQSEKERSAEGGQGDDVECVKSCNQLAKDGKGPNVRELAAFSGSDVPNVNNKERKRVKEMYTKSSYSSHLDGYEPLLYSQSDLDEVLRAREEDWKMKEEGWKAKVKEEVSIRELIEEDFKEKMQKLRDENVEMKKVVEEYAKTIIDLSENSKKDSVVKKETLSSLVQEKEQLHKDLDTTEASLLEAYKRIDKMKVAIESYKKNEELLKGSNEDALDKLTRSEEKYLNLKKHVQEKIDQANTEIAKVRKSKEVDMAGLQAANKKLLSKITTLEQALEQKCKENEELTTICDDLISRVSQE